MGDNSAIEWTDATWNPLTGCTRVSAGCDNCYAAREAAGRLSRTPAYEGLAVYVGSGEKRRAAFNGRIRLLPDRLEQPLKWKRPRRVFVNSMSDLFHRDVPDEFIDQVFAVMQACPTHTFQVLTKRPERMRDYMNAGADERIRIAGELLAGEREWCHANEDAPWPLPNVWLGVSVEDQATADERIPLLLETPAAVRWLSMEPLLGPVDLSRWLWMKSFLAADGSGRLSTDEIDWVVVGGESGPHARPMHPQWARDIRDACAGAGVPFHFKQWGEWKPRHCTRREDPTWDGGVCIDVEGAGQFAVTVFSRRRWHTVDETTVMQLVGKKAAGRELDGRTWDEYPEIAA